jgi:hypothetical protein
MVHVATVGDISISARAMPRVGACADRRVRLGACGRMHVRRHGRRARRRDRRRAQLSSHRRPRDSSRRHRAVHDRRTDGEGRQRALASHQGSGRDLARRGRRTGPLWKANRLRASLLVESLGSGAAAGRGRSAGVRRHRRQRLRRALFATEAQARAAKKATWASPSAIKNAESSDDILTGIGRFTVVEGRVLSVRQAGATTYLNFGRNWTRDFAVTISRRMMPAIESAGLVPKSLESRRIRVRGWVEAHGGPRIDVRSPEQD